MTTSIDQLRARMTAAAANTRQSPTWNLETAGGVASLHVYGVIGGFWGDVAAADVVPAIRDLDVATLNVYVNSPGGDVYDGIAIRNALRAHPAEVVVTVDGLAASAASFIACAGDRVIMAENSELMIHDAWTIALGNAAELRDAANDLDRISDNIAAMYAAKAGGDPAAWRDLMKAETWYTAAEAVNAGLADATDSELNAETAARFDLTMFAHQGRANAPAPAALATHRKDTHMTEQNAAREIAAEARENLATALAEAPSTPGQPVAAEYAAGPQQTVQPTARTEDRPQSLNSLMPELLNAARDSDVNRFVRTINNALSPVVPADDTGEGYLSPQRVGGVWQAAKEGRPVIESLGAVRPLTGTTIEGFRWVQPTPAPETYAGNTTEVPSDPWTTEKVTADPDRWAKANKIDRIYTDLGSEDLIRDLFGILDKNYQGVSDSAVFSTLQTEATAMAAPADLLTGISKAYLTLKKIGARPTKFWIAEDLFEDFASLTVAQLPAWIANATGFVHLDGNISLQNVLDVDVNFDLAAGGFLAYDPRAATVYETPTIKLQAQDVGHGAIDIGWFAYGGCLVNDERAILSTTITLN